MKDCPKCSAVVDGLICPKCRYSEEPVLEPELTDTERHVRAARERYLAGAERTPGATPADARALAHAFLANLRGGQTDRRKWAKNINDRFCAGERPPIIAVEFAMQALGSKWKRATDSPLDTRGPE